MTEAAYQAQLIKRIERRFPGCRILKNDPQHLQGILDLTVLYGATWAMLEVKASLDSPFQPNQEHYIRMFHDMSFAVMICPENETEVLDALQEAFSSRRTACIS